MHLHHAGDSAAGRGLFLAAARLPLFGHHVLVLDDDKAAREVLQAVLEAEGANVVAVGTAAEDYLEIERTSPDVVVTDIGMPVIDGFTFVEQLRRKPVEAGGQTPVAALTGYLAAEDQEHAKRAGFQAYLLKPVEPSELIQTIKALASAKQCTPASDPSETLEVSHA